MTKVKKGAITVVVLLLVAGGALYLYLVFSGPRMTVQPHVRAYQRHAPGPAAGTMSVVPDPYLGNASETPPPTGKNLAAADACYRYYCLFCHGEEGGGNGPVGDSYVPRPADLRNRSLATLPDAELLKRTLSGIGHEPVMRRTIPPEYRPYVLLAVRRLAQGKTVAP